MIIKELRIHNFGKFNNRNIILNKGLNLLYGENEAGKTTTHTFIRGMLFGIEKARGRTSQNDLYTKYQPWVNPTYYAGTMIIEVDGTRYRLERNFYKENKSFQVINEDEGVELSKEEIASLFEGLDETCYYNTISISQLGSKPGDELQAILKNYAANLVNTKSIELDMNQALENLKQKKKEFKVICKGYAKEQLILSQVEAGREIETLYFEQAQLQEENINNQKENSRLAEEITKLKKIELDNRDQSTKALATKELLESRIDELLVENRQLGIKQEEQAQILNDISDELVESGVNNELDFIELNKRELKRGIVPKVVIFLLCLELLAIGYSYFWLDNTGMIKILFGTVLGTAVLFIISLIYNKGQKQVRMARLQQLKDLMERKKEGLKNLEGTLLKISSNHEHIKKIQEEALLLSEQEIDRQLEAKISEISDKIEQLSTVVQNTQWKLEQNKQAVHSYLKEQEDIKERLEELKKAEEEIEAIDLAISEIENVSAEIRKEFSKELNKKASSYICDITKGKYNQLVIDDNLNILVNGKDRLISHEKLSKGTMEQIYFSLRLAASSILFSDKMPVILDDTFAHYDNKRMANTLEALSSHFEQALVFTCHTREKVIVDRAGIPYHLVLIHD